MPRGTQDTGQLATPTPTGLSPCLVGLSRAIRLGLAQPCAGPTTPTAVAAGLGFSTFARHYSQNCFFSSGYSDVSLPRVPAPFGA